MSLSLGLGNSGWVLQWFWATWFIGEGDLVMRGERRLSAFWEWGSPDLPACGLQRGSPAAQYGPSSSTQAQDPRKGPSLAGRTMQGLLRGGLVSQACEEA